MTYSKFARIAKRVKAMLPSAWEQQVDARMKLIDLLHERGYGIEAIARAVYGKGGECVQPPAVCNEQPGESATNPDVRLAVLLDRMWVAGARFGWNCGVSDNRRALNDAIDAHMPKGEQR